MRGVPFSGERSLRLSPFIVSTSRGSQLIQSTPAPAPPRGGRGARIELTSRRTPAPARERSRSRERRAPGDQRRLRWLKGVVHNVANYRVLDYTTCDAVHSFACMAYGGNRKSALLTRTERL